MSKKNVKVYLDAGHGGKDSGASSNGVKEKNWTLDIDNRLAELIENQDGLELVGRTRTTDKTVDSTLRATKVSNSGADYCISSHINAGGGLGAETIHSIYNNGELAREILQELKKIGLNMRRTFSKKGSRGDYYFMHRQTGSVTTTIVEYGFIDTKKDREFLAKAENRQKCAEAVIRAICKVEGIEFKSEEKESVKQVNEDGILYHVQTGAFKTRSYAVSLSKKIREKGFSTYLVKNDNLFKVQVGAFSKKSNAKKLAKILKGEEFDTYITTKSGDPVSVKENKVKKPAKPKANLKVDGYVGEETIKALQRYFKTPVDGKISKPSLVVKEIQKVVGAKVDGYLGKETISKMQKHFNTPIDGKISKPSLLIKEMQKHLNKGNF